MNILIVGCSRVGGELALLLSQEGNNVTIVDKQPESFKRLGGTFNGQTVTGHGIDLETLAKAGIATADAVVVVTNGDNTNIMISQIAKNIFHVPNVIARMYDPRRSEIYQHLGLDIISGTTLVAAMIRDKMIDRRLSAVFLETSELGSIRLTVPANLSGKLVGEINEANEFLINCIVRKNKSTTIIPLTTDRLETGDTVVGVIKKTCIKKISKLFEESE